MHTLLFFCLLVCIKAQESVFCVADDPCREIRRDAYAFSRLHNVTVDILCVEQIKACIEVYYCLSDTNCLHSGEVLGILQLEQGEVEGAADPTTVYFIVGGVTLFLAVGVLFTLVLLCECHAKERRESLQVK